ncbi:MAG: hypothetical protein NC924_05360 [Candidatus Omnitrophica bacterium]|nr:hypothetical protein [Candidatus Omnitrophota bacterium]
MKKLHVYRRLVASILIIFFSSADFHAAFAGTRESVCPDRQISFLSPQLQLMRQSFHADFERTALRQAVERHWVSVYWLRDVARQLGIPQRAVEDKLAAYGLSRAGIAADVMRRHCLKRGWWKRLAAECNVNPATLTKHLRAMGIDYRQVRKEAILDVVQQFGGNITAAARFLEIDKNRLYRYYDQIVQIRENAQEQVAPAPVEAAPQDPLPPALAAVLREIAGEDARDYSATALQHLKKMHDTVAQELASGAEQDGYDALSMFRNSAAGLPQYDEFQASLRRLYGAAVPEAQLLDQFVQSFILGRVLGIPFLTISDAHGQARTLEQVYPAMAMFCSEVLWGIETRLKTLIRRILRREVLFLQAFELSRQAQLGVAAELRAQMDPAPEHPVVGYLARLKDARARIAFLKNSLGVTREEISAGTDISIATLTDYVRLASNPRRDEYVRAMSRYFDGLTPFSVTAALLENGRITFPALGASFGDNLRVLRDFVCLTQAELAQMINMSEETVRGWECKRSMPDDERVYKRLVDAINRYLPDSMKIDVAGLLAGVSLAEFLRRPVSCGERIRMLRRCCGMSFHDLGSRLGYTDYGILHGWERGKMPAVDKLPQLVIHLRPALAELDVSFLVRGVPLLEYLAGKTPAEIVSLLCESIGATPPAVATHIRIRPTTVRAVLRGEASFSQEQFQRFFNYFLRQQIKNNQTYRRVYPDQLPSLMDFGKYVESIAGEIYPVAAKSWSFSESLKNLLFEGYGVAEQGLALYFTARDVFYDSNPEFAGEENVFLRALQDGAYASGMNASRYYVMLQVLFLQCDTAADDAFALYKFLRDLYFNLHLESAVGEELAFLRDLQSAVAGAAVVGVGSYELIRDLFFAADGDARVTRARYELLRDMYGKMQADSLGNETEFLRSLQSDAESYGLTGATQYAFFRNIAYLRVRAYGTLNGYYEFLRDVFYKSYPESAGQENVFMNGLLRGFDHPAVKMFLRQIQRRPETVQEAMLRAMVEVLFLGHAEVFRAVIAARLVALSNSMRDFLVPTEATVQDIISTNEPLVKHLFSIAVYDLFFSPLIPDFQHMPLKDKVRAIVQWYGNLSAEQLDAAAPAHAHYRALLQLNAKSGEKTLPQKNPAELQISVAPAAALPQLMCLAAAMKEPKPFDYFRSQMQNGTLTASDILRFALDRRFDSYRTGPWNDAAVFLRQVFWEGCVPIDILPQELELFPELIEFIDHNGQAGITENKRRVLLQDLIRRFDFTHRFYRNIVTEDNARHAASVIRRVYQDVRPYTYVEHHATNGRTAENIPEDEMFFDEDSSEEERSPVGSASIEIQESDIFNGKTDVGKKMKPVLVIVRERLRARLLAAFPEIGVDPSLRELLERRGGFNSGNIFGLLREKKNGEVFRAPVVHGGALLLKILPRELVQEAQTEYAI